MKIKRVSGFSIDWVRPPTSGSGDSALLDVLQQIDEVLRKAQGETSILLEYGGSEVGRIDVRYTEIDTDRLVLTREMR